MKKEEKMDSETVLKIATFMLSMVCILGGMLSILVAIVVQIVCLIFGNFDPLWSNLGYLGIFPLVLGILYLKDIVNNDYK